jgi:acetyl esterase/lipase
MEVLRFRLSERYPFLGDGGGKLTAFLQEPFNNGSPEPEARPAFLILPGGGYVCCCSDREGWPVAMSFSETGIQCFVLEYSVAPEHRWPQALLEVSAALDLIRENAEKWHIDPKKLLICGFSAGGHLAASYCTLRHDPDIARHITGPDLAGAVLCYPVITAEPGLRHEGSFRSLAG